jgi:hypothetical protein
LLPARAGRFEISSDDRGHDIGHSSDAGPELSCEVGNGDVRPYGLDT